MIRFEYSYALPGKEKTPLNEIEKIIEKYGGKNIFDTEPGKIITQQNTKYRIFEIPNQGTILLEMRLIDVREKIRLPFNLSLLGFDEQSELFQKIIGEVNQVEPQ